MSNRFVPVDGHPDYVRDMSTGALLNINKSSIERARQLKRERLRAKEEKESLVNKVESLESDVQEIKTLLQTIAERLTNA